MLSPLAALLTAMLLLAGRSPAQSEPPANQVTPDTLQVITDEQRREMERISTLGYFAAGHATPPERGLITSTPDAFQGYTVYVSRDYAGAFLVNMSGRILHQWTDRSKADLDSYCWTRVWVEPDGGAIGISANPGRLRKLDADSNVIWEYGDINLRPHHDVRVGPDGRIYVLMRHPSVLPWLREDPVSEGFVCILEQEGGGIRQVDCISIPEAFRDSDFAGMLAASWFQTDSDPWHTNSLDVLDGRIDHPAFKAGNILLSIRNMDCLAVLDPVERKIVWVNRGRWQRQHEALVSSDGKVLVFDNRMLDGQSRVVEYDVLKDRVTWDYTAEGFFTHGTGAEQELPNGDILITESESGRVFEVTRAGRVVWEYLNPRTISHDRVIVRIPRAFRVPYDYFTGPFGDRLKELRGRG